ncbi:C-type lectin domain family 2 member D-related protein-like [Heteronotia binoei]|uniref:C-type lectin domain family 2 member D-related protein-like n=1 Tax=Heteronotia binoei TaxID=13085 RepID=UPI00292D090C|nr:C-type lectin domain family 2 member D-related protein-like [Heteronotia binoei]
MTEFPAHYIPLDDIVQVIKQRRMQTAQEKSEVQIADHKSKTMEGPAHAMMRGLSVKTDTTFSEEEGAPLEEGQRAQVQEHAQDALSYGKDSLQKENSQPTASGNSDTTPGSKGKGETFSENEKDHTDELMLIEQWVDFNFNDSNRKDVRSNSRVQNSITWIVLIVFTIQIVGLITTVFVFTMAKPHLPSSSSVTATPCCPRGWITTQGSCFHFLDLEGAWEAGQQHCSSLGASLAVIDNLEKLNSAVPHKVSFNYWVGLLREPGESWKWPDGTAFNNYFEVEGEGPCAYLNNRVVSSANCSTEKKWLCSQRARQGTPGHCKGT